MFLQAFLKIPGLSKRDNAQYQIISLLAIASCYLAQKFNKTPGPDPLPPRPGSPTMHQHSSNGTCILSPPTTGSRRNNPASIVAFDSVWPLPSHQGRTDAPPAVDPADLGSGPPSHWHSLCDSPPFIRTHASTRSKQSCQLSSLAAVQGQFQEGGERT